MKLCKLRWYINRFKSMEIKEVLWRVKQKKLAINEKKIYGDGEFTIISDLINKELSNLKNTFNHNKLGFNTLNEKYTINNSIDLFNKFFYEKYKFFWHAGFNTENSWIKVFSYDLDYKQRDNIGDARINWELNRHYQLAILAKNYYITREEIYIDELKKLFYDWNDKNPFLIGISWTSVMEVAIRAFSWMIALFFLEESEIIDKKINDDLKFGIINMIDYVDNHHSKYSSANNHLIIEMVVLGVGGILFQYNHWYKKAIDILDYEIFKQNTEDGVNKECSIHYQSFVMESLLLLMIIMDKNNMEYPETWKNLIDKMSQFMADNMDENYKVSNLGDSDEGKILDLCGKSFNHYKYVLELSSILLKKRYVNLEDAHENIYWLFSEKDINMVEDIYDNSVSKCYKIGGYTIMKSKFSSKNKVMIVIDHADLGYGSIAAHGHADALSFTMNVNGNNIFVDPGTYIYHIDIEFRNYFRKTINHNTISFNDKDQSEMLGAFLWGKKANSILHEYSLNNDSEVLIVSQDGYNPDKHKRQFKYNRENKLIIKDYISGKNIKWTNTLILDPSIEIVDLLDNKIILSNQINTIHLCVNKDLKIEIEEVWISEIYGNKTKSKALKIKGHNDKFQLNTEIIVV